MFRLGLTALKLGIKTTEQSTYSLHLSAVRREFTSKETANRLTKDATRIAQDAGRVAQDSSKVLLRVLEELCYSNEVKLVRLSAIRAYAIGRQLFDKHVVKNPSFQSFLVSLKAKLEQISTPAESKQELTEKAVTKNEEKKLMDGETQKKEEKGAKPRNEKEEKSEGVKN